MRPLSEEEKKEILSTLEPIIGSSRTSSEVTSICVYGSQVAGYAREDSDYDVIIALTPFKQKIKYYYLKGSKADCSALVIDSKSFENDCDHSTFGEFVSGRLLNPFEALLGQDFMLKNEVAYKRRVILEGLVDALVEFEDFSSELEFELPYFLFEKLRKRAAIYPPVVYSYSQTYGENLIEENLESSLRGFRKAAESLKAEGLIDISPDKDTITVLEQKRFGRGGLSRRFSVAASYTTKSIRQYAIHGYAGRVRPTVVGKEVISKLSRSRNQAKLPESIHSPKSYWKIPEGKLFGYTDDWMADLIDHLGMQEKEVKVNQKPMGEIYTASSFYTLDDGKRKYEIAVKRFKDIKSMKWGILNLWSLKNANFVTNPILRMYREYHGLREFRKLGIRTPEAIAVFLSQQLIVTSFIQGKDLSRIQSDYLNEVEVENLQKKETKEEQEDVMIPLRKFGGILATLHNDGYCMGDSKPSNAILSDKDSEIYLVDLEQSHDLASGGNPTWDVAEFIYYSIRFTMKEEKARKMIHAFTTGYVEKSEKPSIVQNTSALRYRAPFQAFIAPNVLGAILKDLRSISAESGRM